MTSRLSNIELGLSESQSYSTTTGSSFTNLFNSYKNENFAPSGKGSNIDFGHEEATYDRTALCAEPFRGFPEQEENLNKTNNSKTYVQLGIYESKYETSSISSENYKPQPPSICRHRQHMHEIYKDKKNHLEEEDKVIDMYHDDVDLGDAKMIWQTESNSKFIQHENCVERPNRDGGKTQWTMGNTNPTYTTTMASSYPILNKKQLKKPESCKKGYESSVYMGNDKINYVTSGLFSKQYKKLEK